MYYTATHLPSGGRHVVKASASDDLVTWTTPRIAFDSATFGTYGGSTESPFVVRRADKFYLFVNHSETWGIYNDTAVYSSDDPFHWQRESLVPGRPMDRRSRLAGLTLGLCVFDAGRTTVSIGALVPARRKRVTARHIDDEHGPKERRK